MQDGQIIYDRWFEVMIRDIADELGVSYRNYSHGWVWQLASGDTKAMICGYKFDINSAAAAAVACDKVAASVLLESAGISTAMHQLIRVNADGTFQWYGNIEAPFVVKPLSGTSGSGVKKCDNKQQAEAWMRRCGGSAWAVSPFYDIKREIRSIVLDGEILLSYEKLPVSLNGMKMFNLGLGAVPKELELDDEMKQVIRGAMHAIGLRVAAIDCIETADGALRILEVNDGIMMENYMRRSARRKEAGRGVYQRIIERMMEV